MVLLTHYYALALAGALLTGAWLFIPKARLPVTTLVSFLIWFLLALLGDQTEIVTQHEFIAVPVPAEFRYLMAFLGLLSGLALIFGVYWDVYPPQETTDA